MCGRYTERTKDGNPVTVPGNERCPKEVCLGLEGSRVRILLTGQKSRNSFINAKLQLDV